MNQVKQCVTQFLLQILPAVSDSAPRTANPIPMSPSLSCSSLGMMSVPTVKSRLPLYGRTIISVMMSIILSTEISSGALFTGSTYGNMEYQNQWEHIYVTAKCSVTVTYCKRGYFRWGKISRKCWQDVSRGGNFHDSTHISFIKTYGFYFRVGVIFAKKTKSRKSRKLPPRENFHVYSTFLKSFLYTYLDMTCRIKPWAMV